MTLEYEIYKEGGILEDRYQKIEDISEGAYGYVSLAKDIKAKRLVAVKYIFKLEEANKDKDGSNRSSIEKQELRRKSRISDRVRARLSNSMCLEAMYEVDMHAKIGKHKNIVELLDYFGSYIVMEYCVGGDLYESIRSGLVPRKTKQVKHIIDQILDAIEFVHSKGIYHRDLKPENILISGIDWTIKVTDWGLATTEKTSIDRNVGSERYMAPELFQSNLDIEERKEPYVCAKVDIWALGIVFLNIVFHKNPFTVANQSDKAFCFFAANREALFDVFSTMTYDFFQVLRHCLTIDPTNRNLEEMKNELAKLNEFTLDDAYYNNASDDYAIDDALDIDSKHPPALPPSSAPVVMPLPTPSPSLSKNREHDDGLSPLSGTHVQQTKHYMTQEEKMMMQTNQNDAKQKRVHRRSEDVYQPPKSRERAKSVPKFRFSKLPSFTKYNNNNTHYNVNYKNSHAGNNITGHSNNYHTSSPAIKINNAFYSYTNKGNEFHERPKVIKQNRKPLGIPTPNTHINQYLEEYRFKEADERFNTRDFFTPPSVQNRYMEGILNSQAQHKKSRPQKPLKGNLFNNRDNINLRRGRNSAISQNGKLTVPRGSSNQFFTNLPVSQHNGEVRRHSYSSHHSPGSYIPPNLRGNYSTFSASHKTNKYMAPPPLSVSPNFRDISSVLDDSYSGNQEHSSHHENFNHTEHANNSEHDSDDVLFTLEENESDFVHDMDKLSLKSEHDGSPQYLPDISESDGIDYNIGIGQKNHIMSDNELNSDLFVNEKSESDVPDLLKSPVMSQGTLSFANSTRKMEEYFDKERQDQDTSRSNASATPESHDSTKSNIYVPPHHRKSSNTGTGKLGSLSKANEATLSVSKNDVKYGGSYTVSATTKPGRRSSPAHRQESRQFGASLLHTIPQPFMHHSGTTTAVQSQDVFADDNDGAIVFEEDEEPESRTIFGPYKIYEKPHKGRRSSHMQEAMVGSLEQYKNNWLILQQPE